ncbi:threonine ammonia-lyase [Parasphingopyxis lamellibrachiae]|uniref:L-threonine ammonia-lyase n=1 Tax=Parasphingopyxis lamellibrachiae TaxID=680125 RepID=A0A3D9FEF9_9SPHN|nr:threonine/serine dehydratase [Parasphingopyxis lamellibrachiae]RED15431.1 L-threonine ammonia-lyase [Parasphingopyxis lamellibrachiae]
MQNRKSRTPTLAGVKDAAERIREIVPPTPLVPFETEHGQVWLKCENLQPIGAFKLRGGYHRLAALSEEQRKTGVVAFSSGNHAQGVAWAAKRLGMPALIVMPADAPRAKLDATRALGAEIVTYDRMTEGREELAARLGEERGAVVVPSFDDPWVVEGQGTAALEAVDQMTALAGGPPDSAVTCCGGGGLSAGTALVLPDAQITIVEPEGWDDMARSLATGKIEPVGSNPPDTRCDALQTMRVAPITFDILKAHGATGVAVSEAEVAHAMRVAYSRLQLVVEPGGAVALAAVLSGKVKPKGRTMVTLSGGNVDPAIFAEIILG